MSLCLMNVHGDIEGDYEFVCDIPNGTNGEVVQALFPKAKIFENESKTEYRYVDVFLCSEHDMNCFTKEWWNAPYRADKEAEENEI